MKKCDAVTTGHSVGVREGGREGRLERRLVREGDATAAETEPLPPEAEPSEKL